MTIDTTARVQRKGTRLRERTWCAMRLRWVRMCAGCALLLWSARMCEVTATAAATVEATVEAGTFWKELPRGAVAKMEARGYAPLDAQLAQRLGAKLLDIASPFRCDLSDNSSRHYHALQVGDALFNWNGEVFALGRSTRFSDSLGGRNFDAKLTIPRCAAKAAGQSATCKRRSRRDAWFGQLGGGCCSQHWLFPALGRTDFEADAIKKREVDAARGVMIVLSQHHGATYFHALSEVLPRVLVTLQLLSSDKLSLAFRAHARNATWVLPRSGVLRKWVAPLIAARAPSSRIEYLARDQWLYATRMLIPAPPNAIRPCAMHDVVAALKRTFLGSNGSSLESDNFRAAHSREDGYVLLLSRGEELSGGSHCSFRRCMRNFEDVLSALQLRFGSRVRTVPMSGSAEEYLKLFATASAVVGIHGAGFQNIIFMPRGALVVHVGAYNDRRSVHWYGALAHTFGLRYRGVMSDDPTFTSNSATKITLDVDTIMRELENAQGHSEIERVLRRV